MTAIISAEKKVVFLVNYKEKALAERYKILQVCNEEFEFMTVFNLHVKLPFGQRG